MNSGQIRLWILGALLNCGPHKLPESTLKETIKQLCSEDISETVIGNEIAWLKSKGLIDYSVGEIDSVTRWFITEAGKQKVK